MKRLLIVILTLIGLVATQSMHALDMDSLRSVVASEHITITHIDSIYNRMSMAVPDTAGLLSVGRFSAKGTPVSPYELPYSLTGRTPDWHRLWLNTSALSGAFVGTLLVLECLPEDATTWNRAELRNVPLYTRWYDHVFKKGPEWDHDKFIFNYVLHPYAGAVYYMGARSCGFNVWQSLLYCTLISNVGWEFGVEAFMERPSYQDLMITPLVGSLIGEGFYCVKRRIVDNGYTLFGSRVVGGIVAFLVDPVNEFVSLFAGNPARDVAKRQAKSSTSSMTMTPLILPGYKGFTFAATF